MTFLQWLNKADKIVFILINHDSDHQFLDFLMLALRNPYTWVPLYLYLLWFIIKKRKMDALPFICLSILTFAITDSVSSSILKPIFERPRPCNEPSFHPMVRSLIDCGGYYSFPSSHAANHFGLATFWYLAIRMMTGRKWKWLLVWAVAIGYAQIYVGKHYPGDILAGAIFGWVVGSVSEKVFGRWAFPLGNVAHPNRERKENAASLHFHHPFEG